ncbi:hypothetical protein GCM10023335_60810 [Streptomyces siamensis]|uniref:Uncharacterized protein n=1 Tax=Streptomyces siamensis TaxID=1274986 RepID=A0ABP9JCE1_9ACTN
MPSWYAHASLPLAAGLLALFVLFVRRLGPAATVLPWCAFHVATRSQDGYYLMMTPLWTAAAVTAPSGAFAPDTRRTPDHRSRTRCGARRCMLELPFGQGLLRASGTRPLPNGWCGRDGRRRRVQGGCGA